MINPTTDRTIRAVFFDAVGTLLLPAEPVVDTYRRIALRHGLIIGTSVIGARLRESYEKQERLDHELGWRTNEDRERGRWQAIVHETLREAADPEACLVDLWEWYRSPTAWKLQADTGLVLREFAARGIVIGMASNFDARLAGIVNAFTELAPLAENCLISSLVGWRKPSGEFFREVIRRSGCAAEEILFVGDDVRNDLHGAQRAGMRALLLDPEGKFQVPERIERLVDVWAGNF